MLLKICSATALLLHGLSVSLGEMIKKTGVLNQWGIISLQWDHRLTDLNCFNIICTLFGLNLMNLGEGEGEEKVVRRKGRRGMERTTHTVRELSTKG